MWPASYTPPAGECFFVPPPKKALKPGLTCAQVIDAVSRVSGVNVADITGKARFSRMTRLRFVVIHLTCKYRPDYSLTQIGAAIGKRDHSTVIHGKKQADRLLAEDKHFVALVKDAEALL